MIKFLLMALRDPRDPSGPIKHFARIIRGDYLDYESLIRLISKMSSINYGVIQGVIGSLVDVIEEQLIFGRTVQLGDLGTIYMTLRSQSTEDPDDFEVSNVEGAMLHFRPSQKLRKTLGNLKFERVYLNGHDNGQSDEANEGNPASEDRDVKPDQKDV